MGFYLLFMLVINLITFPIAASIELQSSLFDAQVWHKFSNYIVSSTFLSTMVSLAFSIFVSLLYSDISEHLGHNVLLNFFSGKYHQPKEESRVFMFLDMKSSTSFAEQLGHKTYFRFLSDYYNQLSNAIIQNKGEVYQYVGDEIVVTWEKADGLERHNCIRCFYDMKQSLQKKSSYFEETYGVVPSFRAAIHTGPVTTGEIGALKKEIFFTGDVLNVTASRNYVSLCNRKSSFPKHWRNNWRPKAYNLNLWETWNLRAEKNRWNCSLPDWIKPTSQSCDRNWNSCEYSLFISMASVSKVNSLPPSLL